MTFLPTSSSKAPVHFVIPRTFTFHMLPQHRSSQWSVVLQEQTTPVLVPHRLNFLPARGSCMCSSAQAPAPTRSLLQHGLLRGCKFIQGISTCSSVESSKAALQVSSPQWSFMCCRRTRTSLLFSPAAAEEFLLQCMEHLLPVLLPWCLQHCSSHILLTSPSCSCAEVLPFLKYLFPSVPPPWPRGLTVPCDGSVGVVWKCLSLTWGIPIYFSQRAPLRPPYNQNFARDTK